MKLIDAICYWVQDEKLRSVSVETRIQGAEINYVNGQVLYPPATSYRCILSVNTASGHWQTIGLICDDYIAPYHHEFYALPDKKLFAADPKFFEKLRTEIEYVGKEISSFYRAL